MNKPDEAIAWLTNALDAGFPDQETLEKDDDIDPLRKDPRFIRLTGLNPPAEESPAKRWAYDLEFLGRRMEQMHWRLYAHVPKETFRGELTRLAWSLRRPPRSCGGLRRAWRRAVRKPGAPGRKPG